MSWDTQEAKAHEQVDTSIFLAKKYVLPWWGRTLREFPSPFWPGLMACYAAHECAMRYLLDGVKVFAPARFVLTNYPEVGPANLTAKKGDNEVARFGKHPYEVRSHFWAAQQAFWEGKAWVEPLLAKYGFPAFDKLSAYDQFSLLLLPRAIGIGCTKGLLRKGSAMPQLSGSVMDRAERWLRLPNADTTPFDGAQTTETVRLRFIWGTRMVLRAREINAGDMPLTAIPPAVDPGNLVPLPKDFMTDMQWYKRQARRQGPTPTGPYAAG